jgi:hypothetical protein
VEAGQVDERTNSELLGSAVLIKKVALTFLEEIDGP